MVLNEDNCVGWRVSVCCRRYWWVTERWRAMLVTVNDLTIQRQRRRLWHTMNDRLCEVVSLARLGSIWLRNNATTWADIDTCRPPVEWGQQHRKWRLQWGPNFVVCGLTFSLPTCYAVNNLLPSIRMDTCCAMFDLFMCKPQPCLWINRTTSV